MSDKRIIEVNEAYTSKCDALSLENIGRNEHYLGQRERRGLFKSGTGKLINADLNGAINIMRKRIDLVEIKGLKLYNPSVIKLKEYTALTKKKSLKGLARSRVRRRYKKNKSSMTIVSTIIQRRPGPYSKSHYKVTPLDAKKEKHQKENI